MIYRATNVRQDVWMNLSANSNHFFWLTGEVPQTLIMIVNKLQNRFQLHRQLGRRSGIDLRNQVLDILHLFIMLILYVGTDISIT